jgi:hypothetical protein
MKMSSGFADFMSGNESAGALPSSSYRLGVHAAPLHELYSPVVTSALRQVYQCLHDSACNGAV